MAANQKFAHIPNVRERRAARLAEEAKAVAKPAKVKKAKKVVAKDEARAQASEASDSAGAESEAGNIDTQGKEKPLTFGGIDG